MTDRRIGRINRFFVFRHIDRFPLVRASRRFRHLPFIVKQIVEIPHVELGGFLGPGPLDTRGEGVGCLAIETGVGPAEALRLDPGRFRFDTDIVHGPASMRLADGVAAAGQRRSLFVIHRHPSKSLTHVQRGAGWVRITIHTFGVDVDQAHMNRRQRVFQRFGIVQIAIAVLGGRQPFGLGSPIDIGLGTPDILTAETETECLQPHRFIGNRP